MELPNYLDYEKMMQMNPIAYGQAMDQKGLADLFQQQKLQQEGNTTLEGQLRNEQSRSMNPLLVEQQQGINTGRTQQNTLGGMQVERAQARQQSLLGEDQRAAALKLTDDQIKMAHQKVMAGLYADPNSDQYKQAVAMRQMLPEILDVREKHEREMEKVRYQEMQDTGRALERNQTQRDVADRSAEARMAGGGSRGAPASVTNTLIKLDPTRRLGTVQAILSTGMNPDTQQPLSEIERTYFTNMYEQDTRTLDARPGAAQAGKLDMNAATGLKTNPVPSVRMPTDVAPRSSSPVATKKTHGDLAREWLANNPTDPRAAEVKKKLGVN